MLDTLGLEHATEEDCANVKLVCARVSTRAAFLVSAGIASILSKRIYCRLKFLFNELSQIHTKLKIIFHFTAVATILNKIKRPYTTVGVDGSVYKCHPHFHDLMEKKIEELTVPDYKVRAMYFL